MLPHWTVGSTWTKMNFVGSKECRSLMRETSGANCQQAATRTFVRYDLYLYAGLCRNDLADYCRKYIRTGVQNCFKGAWHRRSTVNFIVVDYATPEVVKVAKCLNFINIEFYFGKPSKEFRSNAFIDCTGVV